MKIYCSPYTEDVENFIEKNILSKGKRMLHLVPTLILYRKRCYQFYLKHLSRANFSNFNENADNISIIEQRIKEFAPVYEVDQYLYELVKKRNIKNILSKTEANVLIERVIENDPKLNNYSWKSLSTNLTDFFIYLNHSGLSFEQICKIDGSVQWNEIMKIYSEYLNKLKSLNMIDLGMAINISLGHLDISEYDGLILDGTFLPIMNKHIKIIDEFVSSNKEVIFFLPYDVDNKSNPAYNAIKKVYNSFVNSEDWIDIQDHTRSTTYFLQRLPKSLFKENKTNFDPSVSIVKLPTIEEEMHYIAKNIEILIKQNKVKPQKIAIITPNPIEMRPYIKEVFELYGIFKNKYDRPILHTQMGRGLKYLLDIKLDERKLNNDNYLDINMFREILSSNLLTNSENLINNFKYIESFCTDCTNFESWFIKLNEIKKAKIALYQCRLEYHPLNNIPNEVIDEYHSYLTKIKKITSDLFHDETMTVDEHTKHFIQYINSKKEMFNEIDEDINEKINKVLSLSDLQSNIEISSFEFNRRVSAIFVEIDDDNKENEVNEVIVTGPNNIEYRDYDYVFICRFNNNMYPETIVDNWPMNYQIEREILNKSTNVFFDSENDLTKFYIDRSFYYFLTTLYSPRKSLTISYSQYNNGIKSNPSHYLYDIANVLGLENNENESIEEIMEKYNILRIPATPPSNEKRDLKNTNNSYNLENINILTPEELAVYRYCSRRFYYEKAYNKNRVYTSNFQLVQYASAVVYFNAVKKFVENNRTITINLYNDNTFSKYNKIIPKLINSVISEIRHLFPLPLREWKEISFKAQSYMKSLFELLFKKNNELKRLKENNSNNVITEYYIDENYSEYTMNSFTLKTKRELVQKIKNKNFRFSISNLQELQSFSTHDFQSTKRMDEIKNWYFDLNRQIINGRVNQKMKEEINSIYKNIKNNNFEKDPGGHCTYCTFKEFCLEKEVAIDD